MMQLIHYPSNGKPPEIQVVGYLDRASSVPVVSGEGKLLGYRLEIHLRTFGSPLDTSADLKKEKA